MTTDDASPERRSGDRRQESGQPAAFDVQGLPAWLRAAVFLGVPSVIALFLVYVLTMSIAARVTSIEQEQRLQSQVLAGIAAAQTARQSDTQALREHFDETAKRLDGSIRALCVVLSDTADERASCVTRSRIE